MKQYFFLGIGGIGMSALARYFHAKGCKVAGYDRTSTRLTDELQAEGIAITFVDDIHSFDPLFLEPTTSVVYTPAIPNENKILSYYRQNGFDIRKRAAVLGDVTNYEKALCVAGTHGKTTISTMVAHILYNSHLGCNAFLGGIAKNYTSNLIIDPKSDLVSIEADEFDRSFHHLSPYIALISATDADHLDIYGTHEAYIEAFNHFTSLIAANGVLINKFGIQLEPRLKEGVKHYTYSAESDKADFYAQNIRIANGELLFDIHSPMGDIKDISLGVPVLVNVENGVAAAAVALASGADLEEVKQGLESFNGVRRRFDIRYKGDDFVIIDDYAHHPEELAKSIHSVKALYEGKKILVAFQPHLYTRTRDFYKEFASALSSVDDVIVLELYPAREEPIEGVNSELICNEITSPHKQVCTKQNLVETIVAYDFDVLLTVGAGDIDTFIDKMIEKIKDKNL